MRPFFFNAGSCRAILYFISLSLLLAVAMGGHGGGGGGQLAEGPALAEDGRRSGEWCVCF